MCYKTILLQRIILCAVKRFFFQLNIISLTKIATCIFFFLFFCMYKNIIINFKTRVKSWVKISKVMPQPQVHFPGKGREALRQKVLNLSFKIRYGLTVHIIRFYKFYRQNFKFFKIVPSSQVPANYANSAQFAPHSLRITQNSHILLTFSILCFRYLLRQRTLENSSESREFRTLHTIIKTYVIDFQISDHRQRTQENWSKSTRFRTIRPHSPRITRIPHTSHYN